MKRAIEDVKREKEAIMQAAANLEYEGNFFPEKGDYIGEDGIVICGQCGTPRGRWEKPFKEAYGTEEIIPIPDKCECQKKREAAEAERKEQAIRQTEQEDKRQRFLKSEAYRGIRVGNSDYKLGNVAELSKGMKYAQKLIAGEINKGLVLSGGCGTGKTHIAACIANELIDNGKTAYMDTFNNMIDDVTNFKTREEIKNILASVDLVIIDDFGAERNSENANEKAFEIIDMCTRNRKPMIITTNLSEAELKKPANRHQQRIYSRMLGACNILTFNNGDIRLECKAAQTQAEFQKLFE